MGPRPAEPEFRRRVSGESYICPDAVGAYIGLGASELVKRRFGGRVGPSCYSFLFVVGQGGAVPDRCSSDTMLSTARMMSFVGIATNSSQIFFKEKCR